MAVGCETWVTECETLVAGPIIQVARSETLATGGETRAAGWET